VPPEIPGARCQYSSQDPTNVFEQNVTKSFAATVRMEVLAALRENKSLENLSMMSPAMMSQDVRFEDYLVFVATIHPNKTLKRLRLRNATFCVDDAKTNKLISVLKKNYGLEELPELHHELNRAGHRYLVQDGSSISKGVDVLSGVSNDISSVFLHLLENPRLCDRTGIPSLCDVLRHGRFEGLPTILILALFSLQQPPCPSWL
jgi:hypothetical protein